MHQPTTPAKIQFGN